MSDPIPTGCGPIDDLLGGGFERGTVTQLYGQPAAGKTNLVLSAAAAVAAEGGTTVIVDTEDVSIDRFEQLVGRGDQDGRALGERLAGLERREQCVAVA